MLKFSILILTITFQPICAQSDGFDNTPVQKDSGYRVHDKDRPSPPKVPKVSAVTTPAPSDATALFDGTNIDAWKGNWKINNSILIASPRGLATKEHFGKVQLHLEFRIPKDRKVISQKGANSDVFMMGLFEIQVQESHSNKTYADGQAGALYGQHPPLVNTSTPQEAWQSYDIFLNHQSSKIKQLLKKLS